MCKHCVSRANTSTKQIESQVSANHPLTPRSSNNGLTFKRALDGSQIGPWIVTAHRILSSILSTSAPESCTGAARRKNVQKQKRLNINNEQVLCFLPSNLKSKQRIWIKLGGDLSPGEILFYGAVSLTPGKGWCGNICRIQSLHIQSAY